MKSKIAIAISGGVDSLMAASILKEDGNDVFGLHFVSGYEKLSALSNKTKDIKNLSNQLNIPIEIVDLKIPLKKKLSTIL